MSRRKGSTSHASKKQQRHFDKAFEIAEKDLGSKIKRSPNSLAKEIASEARRYYPLKSPQGKEQEGGT